MDLVFVNFDDELPFPFNVCRNNFGLSQLFDFLLLQLANGVELLLISTQYASALREKCPNTELFLVCIFQYSDWIRTRNNSVFGHFSRSAVLSGSASTVVELLKTEI